ncbi:MAG: Hsp20/alpha crystallin family protein [Pseudomonadota bacterium]
MMDKTTTSGWLPDFFEPFRHVGQQVADWFSPRSDASTGNGAYEICLELPGVPQEAIDIQLHDGVMTVRGEKSRQRSEERDGYFFSERQYGRFQRTFRLPADASEEGVSAEFKDGVLKIRVPKAQETAPKAKKIAIGS